MHSWASFPRMPALHPGQRQQGLTLIELLLFLVVVGIALSAMLKVFITATAASTDPMVRRQQLAIAESLLREIELMPFTWCDPDAANAATATSAVDCTTQEVLGPEGGESRSGASLLDNVNDYNGFSMNGITDISGAAVAGLGAYKASVSVVEAALDNVPSTEALKITVTVTAPDGNPKNAITLQGWRTRYAPTAAD
ncbi:prepilin-type N-terminal cleavage/methylation domain-containing protein [Roseateles asaccharophilus]|uniref:MSHA pilin protein MshD n=1 Tax=Roseateles asaccharophilus TaxID=582607 RepID=A0ABU2A7D0_9BURK|nr:prepilin-type N-terminal cleavage/methylation domain-containing protein [Roseateles asaccharophilus]MDR7332503.1 MSHA pilin protein MshD [Roseateles asaccharophilus]